LERADTTAGTAAGDRRSRAPGYQPGRREVHGPAFGRANYLLMAAAAVVIVAGFVALGVGSTTLAPILLVLGYLVLIPVSLLKR